MTSATLQAEAEAAALESFTTPQQNSQTAAIFKMSVDVLVAACYSASRAAGWWTDLTTNEPLQTAPRMVAEKLALVHSEISEALEGYRKGKKDDHLTNRDAFEVELADALIRIFDLGGAYGLDLGGALVEKMAYNASRADHKLENRLAPGGKKF